MAKQIESYDFHGPGRHFKYPWADWLNGEIWELQRDVDFKVAPRNFRTTVQQRARARGLVTMTSIVGDKVYIQAKPADSP